jgi:ribonuclease P protein component
MENQHKQTFPKQERLHRQKQIELLFASGKSLMAFPLRIQYMLIPESETTPAQTLFSVPKKRFKRAVKRNLIRRRMKEAFRLTKHELYKHVPEQSQLILAIIYLENSILTYKNIHNAMVKAMGKLVLNLSNADKNAK